VLADQDRPLNTTSESRPTSPQNGRGRGPRSYQPNYQDALSDRTVPQYRVPCPVLYTAEEAKAKGVSDTDGQRGQHQSCTTCTSLNRGLSDTVSQADPCPLPPVATSTPFSTSPHFEAALPTSWTKAPPLWMPATELLAVWPSLLSS